MKTNNALLGMTFYKQLKKKAKADMRMIKKEVDQFFQVNSVSMDANEVLYPSIEQMFQRVNQKLMLESNALNFFLTRIATDSVKRIAQKNISDFKRSFPNVQNVFENRPEQQAILNASIKENVRLIDKTTRGMRDDVETIVWNQIQQGAKKSDIIKALKPILERTESGYKRIARDQGNKLYGSITYARMKINNWQFYMWETSHDVTVRSKANTRGYSDHKRLDGHIFKIGEPPIVAFAKGKQSERRLPPQMDYSCRCTAKVLFDPPEAFEKTNSGLGDYKYKKGWVKV